MRNTVFNSVKLALVAGAFAAGSLAVASPAQAGKYSNYADALKHFTECANWMATDQAKHAQFCSPGHDVFVSGSTGHAGEPERGCPDLAVATITCVSTCCE